MAAVGAALLDELEEAIASSWVDLLPAAAGWGPAATTRARAASAAALRGLLTVFEQGDLDDRSWAEVRDEVYAGGRATPDEAAELLRTVRIVGVEVLADRLSYYLGLTHDERWQLQREASAFCAQLLGTRDELDATAVDTLLAELERSGPDLA